MSEDLRKENVERVASQAAEIGGEWPNAPLVTPKPKPATSPATTMTPAVSANTSWVRLYVSATKAATVATQVAEADNRLVVTLRNALFALERGRGHGGGRGAARAWV
ncbi:hypothetical protein EDC04DRAFT_885698 [Pisolithus marmoratus]|nr:hypothetical protein EDC04DRAFT_885698 [Pisolithus marmoratus]